MSLRARLKRNLVASAQRLLLPRGGVLVPTASADEIRRVLDQFRPLSMPLPLVRIGGEGDGGYLLPDDLEEIDAVYSPGVAESASFESFFADRGINCFLIDASVSAPPVQNQNFHFQSIWLAPETVDGVSTNLQDWVNQNTPNSSSLLLQIDIEGGEYESILSTPSSLLGQFRIIVIELHDLHSIATRMGGRLVSSLLARLGETHHLVHTHVNNCCEPLEVNGLRIPDVVELTLVRKDRIKVAGDFATLPHRLDRPNTSKADWHMEWKN